MTGVLLLSALLMGLLGSAHCVVMCGGVVALGCTALPLAQRKRRGAVLRYALAYNTGRIASYALAGAIAGALGSGLASLPMLQGAQIGLRAVAGVLMVAVGLYVAGLARALAWLERLGAPVWRRIAPIAQRFVPARSMKAALMLGLLWGWLPCGLVYAALAAAVTSGSPAHGALTMLAFGLGTLPALLAMSSIAGDLARAARIRWVRAAAGLAIIAFGTIQLVYTGRALASTRGGDTPACCAGHHERG